MVAVSPNLPLLSRFPTVFATAILVATSSPAAEAPAREDLGRRVKLRILVDKAMQPQAGWTTRQRMVETYAMLNLTRRGAQK